jgi:hypothetical protein
LFGYWLEQPLTIADGDQPAGRDARIVQSIQVNCWQSSRCVAAAEPVKLDETSGGVLLV